MPSEAGILELRAADVDAHVPGREVGIDALPLGEMRRRVLHDPGADRNDQTRLLGDRDEDVGADLAAHRVRPAQQRLDARDREESTCTMGR